MIIALNDEKSRPEDLYNELEKIDESREKKRSYEYEEEDMSPNISTSDKEDRTSIASMLKSSISEILSLSGIEGSVSQEEYTDQSVTTNNEIQNIVRDSTDANEQIASVLKELEESTSSGFDNVVDKLSEVANLLIDSASTYRDKINESITNVLTNVSSDSTSVSENTATNTETNVAGDDNSKSFFKNMVTSIFSPTEFVSEIYNNISKGIASKVEEGGVFDLKEPTVEQTVEIPESGLVGTRTDTKEPVKEDNAVVRTFLDSAINIAEKATSTILPVIVEKFVTNKELSTGAINNESASPFKLPERGKFIDPVGERLAKEEMKGEVINNAESNLSYTNIFNPSDGVINEIFEKNDIGEKSSKESSKLDELLSISNNILEESTSISDNTSNLLENCIKISGSVDKVNEELSTQNLKFSTLLEAFQEELLTSSYKEEEMDSIGLIKAEAPETFKEREGSFLDKTIIDDLLIMKLLAFLATAPAVAAIGAVLTGLAAGGIIGTVIDQLAKGPQKEKRDAWEKEKWQHRSNKEIMKDIKSEELFGDGNYSELEMELMGKELFNDIQDTTGTHLKRVFSKVSLPFIGQITEDPGSDAEWQIAKRAVQYKKSGAKSVEEFKEMGGEDIKVSDEELEAHMENSRILQKQARESRSVEDLRIKTPKEKLAEHNKIREVRELTTPVQSVEGYEKELVQVKGAIGDASTYPYTPAIKEERGLPTSFGKDITVDTSSLHYTPVTKEEMTELSGVFEKILGGSTAEFEEETPAINFSTIDKFGRNTQSIDTFDQVSTTDTVGKIKPIPKEPTVQQETPNMIESMRTINEKISEKRTFEDMRKCLKEQVEVSREILSATVEVLKKPSGSRGGTTVVPIVIKDDAGSFNSIDYRIKLASGV